MIEIEQGSSLLITLPKRGLRIIPPAETAANMQRIRNGERAIPWSSREKARLALIKRDSTMRKRFPAPESGKALMEDVSYGRRSELLSLATELSDVVVREARKIDPNKNIAIVVFGSVARGLVRRSDHEDPSNIDMSVMGNFSEDERLQLLDAIRPARQEMRKRILEACGGEQNFDNSSGNAGVYVQKVDKLINNKFATAKEYIASNAISLHDPVGIWSTIEGAALDHEASLLAEKRTRVFRAEKVIYTSV